MPKKTDPATIRIVVKMTPDDVKVLRKQCDEEVRTVGSWFRLMVNREWKVRKPPKRLPTFQRNQGDGVKREVDVWARLTQEESDKLNVLLGDEGVSISIWFRRRFEREFGHLLKKGKRKTNY